MLVDLHVWDGRNGFLLFKVLEILFDTGRMYLKPTEDGDGFEAHVLEEGLMQKSLLDPELLRTLAPQVTVFMLFCFVGHLLPARVDRVLLVL